MRTPITYYGGKQRLADIIVSMLPKHKIYCEPYFGGGAVFFRKPKAGIEVINDRDNRLINFYLATQNDFKSLQQKIQNSLHSETLYLHAKDIWNGRIEANNVEKAWAVWTITNGSTSGSMHGGWKWCNGTSGSHSAIMMRNKRISFSEELHLRLCDVQISCRDALRTIADRDSADTVFYLDPPYPGSYQGHYTGFKHTDLFELLQLLSKIKGRFILSNYWSQTLRYHILKFGWNFKTIELDLKVNRFNKTSIQRRMEYLVYNFDIEKTLFD